MDDLNGRKLQILQAIILNYLETAEPVGSRYDLKAFSAGPQFCYDSK